MPFTTSDICKIILAIILPPLGVFLERGCGADLLINILLTILGMFAAFASLAIDSTPTATNSFIRLHSRYPPRAVHYSKVLGEEVREDDESRRTDIKASKISMTK